MNIFILNGRETIGKSGGKLNDFLTEYMTNLLQETHTVKSTTIELGYKAENEQQNFIWADLVIFQFPVFWFAVPGILKNYIDTVYGGNLFFERRHDRPYGTNGLLTDKKYFLSATWNATPEAFQKNAFFDGKTVDDVLISMHKTQQYTGMQKLETLVFYDVMTNPDIEKYKKQAKKHLNKLGLI